MRGDASHGPTRAAEHHWSRDVFDVLLHDHLALHVVLLLVVLLLLLLLLLFSHRLRRHHRVLHDRAREGNRALRRLDDGTGERLDDGAGENLLCISVSSSSFLISFCSSTTSLLGADAAAFVAGGAAGATVGSSAVTTRTSSILRLLVNPGFGLRRCRHDRRRSRVKILTRLAPTRM